MWHALVAPVHFSSWLLKSVAATSGAQRPVVRDHVVAPPCRRRVSDVGAVGKRHGGGEDGGPRPGGLHSELQQEKPRSPTGEGAAPLHTLCRPSRLKGPLGRDPGCGVFPVSCFLNRTDLLCLSVSKVAAQQQVQDEHVP